MRLLLITFLFFGFIIINSAQPPSIQWQKCLGGTSGEAGYSIKQNVDGGFTIGGWTTSNNGDVSGNHQVGHSDFWAIKIDSNGYFQWQKCYGGTDADISYSLEKLELEDFIMTGSTTSIDGDVTGQLAFDDIWAVKCDSFGNILWEKCYGGSDLDWGNKVIRNFDQNYLLLGETRSIDYDAIGRHDSSVCPTCSDVWLAKIDSSGNKEWSKCYGGCWNEAGNSIAQTSDSGFVIAASAESDNGDVQGLHGSLGLKDYWILKVDSLGIIQWQKCFGGSDIDKPLDIIQTYDSGYIVTGITLSHDFDVTAHHVPWDTYDVWVVKIDALGNLQWQKCLGGSADEASRKIIQLSDSGYIVLAYTSSMDGDLIGNPPDDVDVWLIKLDQTGNIQWQKCYGGSLSDAAYDMQQTSDGGLVFTGLTNSNDGDVSGNHGDYDIWVVKLAPLPDQIGLTTISTTDFTVHCYHSEMIVTFYSSAAEVIFFNLIDISGKVILSRSFKESAGTNKERIQTDQLANGMYFGQIRTLNGVITKKLIIQN